MQKRILVTGARGFLGRYVALHFSKAGYQVTGVGHGNLDRHEMVEHGIDFWHTADVTLDALVTYAGEPDLIVHCAGSGSVGFSMTHPHQDYIRTVSSTAAVLEYIRLHSPKTVMVYPSSAAVYGLAESLPNNEQDTLKPVSPYGVHKMMAEILCQSYAKNFDLAVVMVRFFSIYGEGLKKQLLWDACSKVARGDGVFSGSGAELRDWLHAEDAASLLAIASAFASNACPVVNGGSGTGISVKDVLEKLFIAYGMDLSCSFSGTVRSGDPTGYQADMAGAMAWGYQPQVDIDHGIDRYVTWYKSENK